jgi:hypothetical protein
MNLFTSGTFNILNYVGFDSAKIMQGQVWRLITFTFVPLADSVILFAISIFFYYWVGTALEREWGGMKFNVFYFSGIIFSALFSFIFKIDAASSYYLNLSMFLAFATIFPEMKILIMFIIPVKIKYLAFLDAALIVFYIITAGFPLLLIPVIALSNYILFFYPMFGNFIRRQRTVINRNVKLTSNVVKFRDRPYHNKCVICGKTDTEFPNMEFRYCSKCTEPRCYCSEHIFNHEHQ